MLGEGAGAMVLESYESAMARGATILGVVAGCGELTDSFHRTRSSPDGKPIIGWHHEIEEQRGAQPRGERGAVCGRRYGGGGAKVSYRSPLTARQLSKAVHAAVPEADTALGHLGTGGAAPEEPGS